VIQLGSTSRHGCGGGKTKGAEGGERDSACRSRKSDALGSHRRKTGMTTTRAARINPQNLIPLKSCGGEVTAVGIRPPAARGQEKAARTTKIKDLKIKSKLCKARTKEKKVKRGQAAEDGVLVKKLPSFGSRVREDAYLREGIEKVSAN